MSLRIDISGIESFKEVCFVRATAADLDDGETLDGLVNPPDRVIQNDDGTTTRATSMSPTPWAFDEDDPTTIFKQSAVTYVLSMATMNVGLGGITRANWKEFWTRINMYESAFGAYLSDEDNNSRPLAIEDVRAHIGLKANVSKMTKAAFNKTITRNLRFEAEWRLRSAEAGE